MLKRILMICTLAFCGVVGVQATEQSILPSTNPIEQNNEENQKDLTPGALVCNGKEDKCLKDGNQEESSSSILFSVFSEDHEDEAKLLACKDCR